MMRKKKVWLNLFIVLIYFFTYLYLAWNKSGGDIFLYLIFFTTILIHSIIVAVALFKNKSDLLYSMIGIVLGGMVCLFFLKAIEYKKVKGRASVETTWK